jgi:nicotinate phosphoribosyltransferase
MLSIEARRILDEAGFEEAKIVASNDLDERIMESLNTQDARISVWGVGTKLATAYGQPALGGVYKMGALRNADSEWEPKLKLSEQAVKTTIPGILQVRRFRTDDGYFADVIYDETLGPDDRRQIVDIRDPTRQTTVLAEAEEMDLLQPVLREGELVTQLDGLQAARERAQEELSRLSPAVRRFVNPQEYLVGIDIGLHELRDRMIREARSHCHG